MISIHGLMYLILNIRSLEIDRGITSVIGKNGSGKSTLLKILSGIAEPESGTILIDGAPPRECEVGWVNEFPDKNMLYGTVADEVSSPLRFRHLPCSEVSKRTNACLDELGIRALQFRRGNDLSGGEKILVALAAGLNCSPQLLILDECDSHIDAARAKSISDILMTCGVPYIIHCTQQMETAARSDNVIVMEGGYVLAAGKPGDVFPLLKGTSLYPLSWRCGICR